jgi:hypothetical protein
MTGWAQAWLSGGVPLATGREWTLVDAATNAWKTTLAADEVPSARGTVLGLGTAAPHTRLVRARYPNIGGGIGLEVASRGFDRLFVRLFVRLLVRSFVRSFVRSLVPFSASRFVPPWSCVLALIAVVRCQ